jgi:hypothetical protein
MTTSLDRSHSKRVSCASLSAVTPAAWSPRERVAPAVNHGHEEATARAAELRRIEHRLDDAYDEWVRVGRPKAVAAARREQALFSRDEAAVERVIALLRLAQNDPTCEVLLGVARVAVENIRKKPQPRGRPSGSARRLAKLLKLWPKPPASRGGRPRSEWSEEFLEILNRELETAVARGAARSRRDALLNFPEICHRPGPWKVRLNWTVKQRQRWVEGVPAIERALRRYTIQSPNEK